MCNMAISFDGKVYCDYFDFGCVECGTLCPEDEDDYDEEGEYYCDDDEED